MIEVLRTFFCIFLAADILCGQAGSPDIVISQVYGGGGNTGAQLKNDFVELFNRGDLPVNVTGWSVQYASATGADWNRTVLSGTIQPGHYLLIQEAAGAGGTTSLPTPDVTGDIPMSATAAKVALVRDSTPLTGTAPASSTIVDFVGYGAASFAEIAPLNPLSNTTAALRKANGCLDTDNNAADFQIGAPNPRNSLSDPSGCGSIGVFVPPLTISQIQGSTDTSPFAGQLVLTTGVVTGRKANGFFLQTPDAEADADPGTSSGLFVFTSSTPPATAAKGTYLRVAGTVSEFRPASDFASPTLTELTNPNIIEVLSTNNPLPAPVLLSSTVDLERYESMRVSIPRLTVVAPTGGTVNESSATATSNGVFFGVLPEVPRPFRKPGIRVPETLPDGTPPSVPRFDGNPERIRVDSRAQGGVAIDARSGSTVESLSGPLDYASRTYTIDLDPDGAALLSNGALASPVPLPADTEFTIASANLERFFDDQDDPATSEAVLTTAAFQNRITKATRLIRDVLRMPDILGVEEMENIETLTALANSVGGYQAYLVSGNDPGGINVGFLVKTSRVQVLSVMQMGKDARHSFGTTTELTNDRPPLVLRAVVSQGSTSFPVTVIVNHLRSLLSVEDPRVQAKRNAEAMFLANLIQARQAADPSENIISIGDYNAFQFNDGYVDVIGTIKGTPAPASEVVLAAPDLVNPDLIDLVDTLPMDQNYSYSFNGDTQTLDHILVNKNMRRRLARFVMARNNADFPESMRNSSSQSERNSDHDVPVAYFTLAPAAAKITAAGVTSAATFLSGAVAPGEIVTIFGTGFGPDKLATLQLTADGRSVTTSLGGVRVLFDGVASPMIYAQAGQVSAVVPYGVAGKTSTDVQLEYSGALTNKVTLAVNRTAPGIFTNAASGTGQGGILNENGSVNGQGNAAARGSVIVLYAEGGGLTATAVDGQVTTGASTLQQPLSVTIGGTAAEVLYAGAAPGLVSGVLQINVRIPPNTATGDAVPVLFAVDGRSSAPGVTLAVR